MRTHPPLRRRPSASPSGPEERMTRRSADRGPGHGVAQRTAGTLRPHPPGRGNVAAPSESGRNGGVMSVDQGFGVRVLEDPLTNKGTAFSEEERSGLGLRGLLPAVVETLEKQVHRRYRTYQEQPTDVARHINLRALQDTNETLF